MIPAQLLLHTYDTYTYIHLVNRILYTFHIFCIVNTPLVVLAFEFPGPFHTFVLCGYSVPLLFCISFCVVSMDFAFLLFSTFGYLALLSFWWMLSDFVLQHVCAGSLFTTSFP
ncbi:hypothetical protein CPC08DRAFT_177712 [Agrocybe pediades]|nr:hypothetical protein CPC08DRAFT_177712 [Agrocybe pediades]